MNRTGKGLNLYFVIIIALLLITVWISSLSNNEEDYTYSEFLQELEAGSIKDIVIQPNKETPTGALLLTMEDGEEKVLYVSDVTKIEDLLTKHNISPVLKDVPQENWFLTSILPIIVMLVIGVFLFTMMNANNAGGGGGKMMNFGKSRARLAAGENKITLKDVAGLKEEKEELEEIVEFLKEPSKFTRVGARIPKGVLLEGAPGTGKTLLAKAIAGEASVPFFSISGSDFVEMFVGVGASRVRDLFAEAKKNSPCIIFIDEIDAVARRRGTGMGGGHDEREQTLNQLLVEMDGFGVNEGIIVMAATNRVDILDPAILRPGRFDRNIPVELPDLAGREAILKVHAKKIKIDPNIDYKPVALMTAGASGAQLANIINEAALRAVRNNRKLVVQEDLQESVEVVIAGQEKKGMVISPREKEMIAYHEVGHALVAAMQSHSAPVTKITIIPRTSGALGYTMQVDEEEKFLMSKDDIFNKIVTFTGGRTAEELIFNTKTTGAANDIEMATKLARAMITQYGMTDEFGMVALDARQSRYLDGGVSSNASPEKAAEIDNMIEKIIKDAQTKARIILTENMDKLHEISKFLIEKENITGDEFMKILDLDSRKHKVYSNDELEKDIDNKNNSTNESIPLDETTNNEIKNGDNPVDWENFDL